MQKLPAAGAAADLRLLPEPRRRAAGLPAGQRGARRQPVVSCGCCATRARSPSGWPSCSAPASTSPALLTRTPEALRMLADDAELEPRSAAALAGAWRQAAGRATDPQAGIRRAARRCAGTSCCGWPAPTCSAGSTSVAVGRALTDIAVATLQVGLDVGAARARGRRREPTRPTCRWTSPSSAWAGSAAARWATARTPTCCSCTGRAPGGADEGEAARGRERRRAHAAPAARPSPRPTRRSRSTPTCAPRAGRARWCAASRRSASTTSAGSSVWEVQALLRAVPVAGDEGLGAEFVELDRPDPLPGRRAHRRADRRDPPDQGPGGARAAAAGRRPGHPHQARPRRAGRRRVDGAAAAAAARRPSCPSCGTPSTVDGAGGAARARPARRRTRPSALRTAWELASRARNAIFLVRGRPSDQLPRPGLELAGVARACGYGPDARPGQFVDDYRRITRHARGVVDQVFYGQPPAG